jgi:nucleoside-diphosphate-sugar epimerase
MDDGRHAILLAQEQSEWRWTRGYVENVAAAIALAIIDDGAAHRVYNVGDEPAPTEREWVRQMGTAAGWTGEIVLVPEARLSAHLRHPFNFHYHLATDTARIRQELKYAKPVGWEEALKRTIEWERSQVVELDKPDYATEDEALAAEKPCI